ncbi:hypothetical protein CHLRE_17g704600v5 [Chlamydomonas reinhardtii]|uniref:EF-hand domain-containing protein n=1 Tax=Chlamydomonas reinhardtii TaxID=3055 RepID=A8IPT6_CHLRE|nr:uncharacterized protein CHLRE_17g704600v5 [Chlamydomonas reinhardtii]PNW70073.1 hypothetical protein CHLRE_17g704600v5 [Chlamydomonas reinhardtii]|eukprot:XP_001691730.1 predicted protein [Chlamydomonas reinhardtii]
MAARVPGLSSRGLTRRYQGAWMTGVAPVVRNARPLTSLSAVLGGGGGSGGGNGRGGNSGGRGGPEQGPSGGSGWGRTAAFALAGGMLFTAEASWAAKKTEPAKAASPAKDEMTVDKVTDMLWNLAGPILTNLGFSGCVGAAAGIALKKVGQFMAVCVGLLFLMVQGLAYTGFITVNWTHVHSTVSNVLDVNKDGKLDANDFKHIVNNGLGVLSQGVPSVGGFLGGFLLAIKQF